MSRLLLWTYQHEHRWHIIHVGEITHVENYHETDHILYGASIFHRSGKWRKEKKITGSKTHWLMTKTVKWYKHCFEVLLTMKRPRTGVGVHTMNETEKLCTGVGVQAMNGMERPHRSCNTLPNATGVMVVGCAAEVMTLQVIFGHTQSSSQPIEIEEDLVWNCFVCAQRTFVTSHFGSVLEKGHLWPSGDGNQQLIGAVPKSNP